MTNPSALLHLLQLASPALPVGAYSYSEGLESLVDRGQVNNLAALEHWLIQELRCGAIRLEAAVMVRAYQTVTTQDRAALRTWNQWLSAVRETEELRLQSWQMGRSLLRLLCDLEPSLQFDPDYQRLLQEEGCNFAIAYAIGAATWQIDMQSALLGYLHSWASNLVSAGVKLIPLGQTAGQQLLLTLQVPLQAAIDDILRLPDDELDSCGWGLALASMAHECQYSRLFRS
ncbi:urease accessory protein UreF [Leptodesmis sp.]|uniref:urease accessory protein UreF n=1 Tax=Leptodesmis sp. TaxID=3100501 RepID=UPI0040534E57